MDAELLQHARWLRRLATDLVGAGEADDLVQQTYLAAVASPPTTDDRSLRPWLARVMRNARSMSLRGRIRRDRRESAEAATARDSEDAETLLERAQRLRMVSEALETIDEPYRTTLLRRYVDDMPAARIAEREGVASGTIRWRTKIGLDLVRAELDRRHRGSRNAWMAALVPIAGPERASGAALTAGTITMKLSTKAAILFSATAAAVTLGIAGWPVTDASEARGSAESDASVAAASAPTPAGSRDRSVTAEPHAWTPTETVRRFASAGDRQAFLARMRAMQAKSLEDGDDDAHDRAITSAADDERFAEAVNEVLGSKEVAADFLLPALDECIDAMPDGSKGTLTLRMELIGAPDVGTVISSSDVVKDLSTDIEPDVVECAVQTGYALELPPPPVAGSARFDLSIAFDRGAGQVFARLGASAPDAEEERVYSEIGADGEPLIVRKTGPQE